jgi:hypothetical protein
MPAKHYRLTPALARLLVLALAALAVGIGAGLIWGWPAGVLATGLLVFIDNLFPAK